MRHDIASHIDLGNGDNTTYENRKALSGYSQLIFGEFNSWKFWQNKEKSQQSFNNLDGLKTEKK